MSFKWRSLSSRKNKGASKRCILQSQADIIQNTRKAMKELEVEKDLLKEEKKKLENVIVELLKVGHGCKEKLDKIKEVFMEE